MYTQQTKQIISEKLHDLAKPMEQYFNENNLDFIKLANMTFHWGIDSLDIKTIAGETVLSVNGWPGKYTFEETPNTRKFLT